MTYLVALKRILMAQVYIDKNTRLYRQKHSSDILFVPKNDKLALQSTPGWHLLELFDSQDSMSETESVGVVNSDDLIMLT